MPGDLDALTAEARASLQRAYEQGRQDTLVAQLTTTGYRAGVVRHVTAGVLDALAGWAAADTPAATILTRAASDLRALPAVP